MQEINISELIPHPRNEEFFDDITGEKWSELLSSIKKRISENKRGNIEPIIITQDKVIVSGHQRVRAFKELNIPTIVAEIRIYNTEDDILLDLLESNIRQRGDVGGSTVKLGRRVKELERLYGVREGSANPKGTEVGTSSSNGTSRMTQTDLAAMLGIDLSTLKRAKTLANLPVEIQELIETKIISPSVASRVISKLSEQEQFELLSTLDTTQKITKQKVDEYISQMKSQEAYYTERISKLESTISRLTKELTLFQDDAEKYSKLKSQIDFLTKQREDLSRQISSATELASLTVRLQKVLEEDLAPIKFKRCMDCLDSSDVAMNNLKEVIAHIEDWVKEMKTYTEGEFIYE